MRTLIFSDTHLTHDYSPSLDMFLRSLIREADQVIVNGDFWDAFHTEWSRFANSRWQELFSLLRQKKAIIIWGNHDLPRWTKDSALFGAQYLERFSLPMGKKELVIEHGHLIAPSFDSRHPFLAWNFSRYVPYRSYSFKPNSWFNVTADLLLREAAKKLGDNQILVTGHSHVAALDAEGKYINSGIMGNGHASWLWIEDGKIRLQRSSYGY